MSGAAPPTRPGRPAVAVCAMGKRPFTAIAGRWIDAFDAHGVDVVDRRAVEVRRSAAIDVLNGGADVVVYAGHGRDRGWSGYQTIRAEHVADRSLPTDPTALVLAFACRTAGAGPGQLARDLVESGRVAAYVGWIDDLPIESGLAVADRFVDLLAAGWCGSVGHLLDVVASDLVAAVELDCARGLRIIGDPGVHLGVRPVAAAARST